jgi:hypothetical protein
MKKIIGFLISLVSVLGINFIPLEMWLYRDFSGASAMLLYLIENVIAIIFATIFVLLFAERSGELLVQPLPVNLESKTKPRPIIRICQKKDILKDYLIISIPFTIGSIIFLLAGIFIIMRAQVQFTPIRTALWWIVGFQILEFFGDFLMLRPLTIAKTDVFLKRSMGRVALLFVSIFIGWFLAFLVNKWFVIPFIVLKTIVDIGEQIQIFTGLRRK